jgi:ABC-type multidrug transport system fused ATPase/permease subunit
MLAIARRHRALPADRPARFFPRHKVPASSLDQANAAAAAGPSNWVIMRRLLALSLSYWPGCLKVMTFQFLLLAGNVAGLWLTGLSIDYIAHQADHTRRVPHWPLGMGPPHQWSSLGVVTVLAAMVLALAFMRAWLDFSYQVSLAQLVQGQIVVELRARVYDKLQRLSFRFFDDHASGSIINRVTGDVQSLRSFVDLVLIQVLILTLRLGLAIGYMALIHLPLTLACLITTPLLWVGAVWFSRIVRPAYVRNRLLVDHLIDVLSENVQGALVVKGFAREQDQIQKFAQANHAVRDQQGWIFWRLSTFIPALGFLSQINLVVLLAYGGLLVVRGQLPLGTGLLVFSALLQQFSNQVFAVSDIANSMQTSLTGARRVFEVLDTPVEIASPPPERAVRLPKARGEVRFENVWFDYKAEHSVLRGVDFQIEPGCCVAILGSTGAGKSALLGLIPRFYDPNVGCVRIDGHDLRTLDLDDLRRNIGLVFQESFLFSNTIAANIAFGHPLATAAQIEHAARLAQAHDFIMALPAGYASVLGEGASNLSGGQRQRLAIARALLLEPPILLLDDPTAAVDPGTEQEILSALDGAMAGRTTFLVAHRVSTLERADLVMVLKEGKVVELGPPSDLLARGDGHYRQVANLQVADDASKAALARSLSTY